MPFILITGIPSSGKSTVAKQLSEFFETKDVPVRVISEHDVLTAKGWARDYAYADSRLEKELRATLKAEYLRHVGPTSVLILDGLNYIKGFRYELYCASKTSKSTQCVIHCDISPEQAWTLNTKRDIDSQYSKAIFDGLVQRYETPDSKNRWDSPLVTVIDTDNIPCQDIHSILFDRKPPPPNQSTQCPPMSDTNFLHEIDKSCQLIVNSIADSIKLGMEGEMRVEGASENFVRSGDRAINLPILLRLKRQFLVYVKAHPDLQRQEIPNLFVQYLNTNI